MLHAGSVSAKVGTEYMKRGSANEIAATRAHRSVACVTTVFYIGIVARNDARYLACSPDGVIVLDFSSSEEWNSEVVLPGFDSHLR